MPVYEYRCEKCDREFEQLVRSSGNGAGIRCPGCRSDNVRRLFSLFGVKSGNRIGPSSGSKCSGCGGGSCSTCR